MLKKLLVPALFGALSACLALPAMSQGNWPERPIRLIVPYPPGGTSDNLGRLVAERLGALLGATVIVDNKPGGTTQIGTDLAARAAPDGYTVLLGAVTAFTVLPHIRSKLPYDPKNGFEPLGGVAEYLSVVAVRKDLGVKTLPELVTLAKSRPGKLTYGSAGLASFGHIAGEIVKREAGIDMLHVPFKGSADAATALAGGQIDVLIDGAVVPLAKGRSCRAAGGLRRRAPSRASRCAQPAGDRHQHQAAGGPGLGPVHAQGHARSHH